MRELNVKEITTAVKKAAMDANYELGEDICTLLNMVLPMKSLRQVREFFASSWKMPELPVSNDSHLP